MNTECLIIGTGIGGLATAIALSDEGIDTVLVTAASQLSECNTARAQGGIVYDETNKAEFINDILEAGHHANNHAAVEQLATLGPALVKDILINKTGVAFDTDSTGEFHLTKEGAHSTNRILHWGDETGKTIENQLLEYCRTKKNIRIITSTTAVNLLMTSYHPLDWSKRHEESRCFGAFLFDQKTREIYPMLAKHTVLATGGVGQLFLHNTNSKFARGDGLALGYRAGCRLENLEFVQFHPTAFYQDRAPRFLITEALRGEGAVLIDENGESFLPKFLSEYPTPELAPRDKVAKAIHQQMLSSGSPSVYLDISHKPKQWVQDRFPFIYRSCLRYGVDITETPIPVVPAAHYHCGGIWTDLEGRSTLKQLWAVGEVACTGVHGANRLASTSLLEGLVWGTRAGKAITASLQSVEPFEYPQISPWEYGTTHADPAFLTQDWLTLKQTMWNYVGLIKTETRLSRAEGILNELTRGIEVFYRAAILSDELIGLRHASLAAKLILTACRRNTHSLGCYLREEREI